MKRRKLIACVTVLFSLLGCTIFVGCVSGITVTVGKSLPQSVIEAQTSVGGVVVPWEYAIVQAAAVPDGPNGYSCTPNSKGCYLSFQGSTNSSGDYPISSEAIPGDWQIGIEADQNCTQGAASQILYLTPSTTYTPTLVVCNSIASGSLIASPAFCTQTLNNATGVMTNDCPSTITLTSSRDVLPTTYALNVSDYSDAGTQRYSFTGNASNPSSIVVPVPPPSDSGQSVLVVYDPQTNAPVGAALFTVNQVVFTPCGTKRNC